MVQFDPQLVDGLIDGLHGVFGAHRGYRAGQTKHGGGCIGQFVATSQAANISRAIHLQGTPIPATIRFSMASGNPFISDTEVDDHGMSVKFHLPDGSTTDIVGRMIGVANARDPEGFLMFFHSVKPDPQTGKPDPAAIAALLQAHPESKRFLEWKSSLKPIASYAQAEYFGVHAYRFVNGDGEVAYGRYRWVPDAGVATLMPEEVKTLGSSYLSEELRARVAKGPVTFHLHLQVAEPGDDVNDGSKEWPASREVINLGRLEITSLIESQPDLVDTFVFDPVNLTDGIEATDDPVLLIRNEVYKRSYARRTSPAGI